MKSLRLWPLFLFLVAFSADAQEFSLTSGGGIGLAIKKDGRYESAASVCGQWVNEARLESSPLYISFLAGLQGSDIARAESLIYRAEEGAFAGVEIGTFFSVADQIQCGGGAGSAVHSLRYSQTDLRFVELSADARLWGRYFPWGPRSLALTLALPFQWRFDPDLQWKFSTSLVFSLGWGTPL